MAARRSTKSGAGELVKSAEIAKRVGVSRSTPRVWKSRYSDYPVEVVPGYWYWHEVRDFLKAANLPERFNTIPVDDGKKRTA